MPDTYGNGQGGAAPSTDQASPYYDAARRRIQQQGQQNLQQNQEGVKRKFASMGNLNSGDYIKESENVTNQTQNQTQGAISDLDLNQAQVKEQQGFQSSEAEKNRSFTAAESQKSRLFNQDLFQQDLDFKKAVQGSNVHFQDIAAGLSQKEYEANLQTNYINSIIGMSNANVDSGKLAMIRNGLSSIGFSTPSSSGSYSPQGGGGGGYSGPGGGAGGSGLGPGTDEFSNAVRGIVMQATINTGSFAGGTANWKLQY